MRKNRVEELTLDEIRTILSAKLQYELEDVSLVTKEWYSVLGVSLMPFDQFVNEKIAMALCDVISEKIVFEDPSPVDQGDFDMKIEEILRDIEQYEYREEVPNIDFHQYLKGLFVSTLGTLDQEPDEPYMGYRQWLQTFLDLAEEIGVDALYLTVDHEVCDELLRRRITREEYLANGLAEIEVMVDVDILLQTMIRPLIESRIADMDLSPREKIEELEKSLRTMRADLIKKLDVAKKIMVDRFMNRVERIFG